MFCTGSRHLVIITELAIQQTKNGSGYPQNPAVPLADLESWMARYGHRVTKTRWLLMAQKETSPFPLREMRRIIFHLIVSGSLRTLCMEIHLCNSQSPPENFILQLDHGLH